MKKNNNTLIIVIVAIIAVVVGIAIGGKNKNTAKVAPAVDSHGHSIANSAPAAPLKDLTDKLAPDFVLADRGGKSYASNELRGKNVVLFFNEGLMCYPACWNQIVSLARDARLNKSDTMVLSVVVDPPQDWQSAIDKMPELAEATVVFDKDATVSKQFGMLTTASSMHYGSLPGHSYVIIDKEGVVRHMFDDPNMAIHNDQLAAEIARLN